MLIRTKEMIFGIGVIWILAASALAAQEAFPPATPERPNYANLQYPQIAEVGGNDVYVRSGPGTSYYFSGKLNQGDRVTVLDVRQGAWAQILPPEGSYSWIAKRFVQLTPENPNTGVVVVDDEGAGARVWAGSDFVEPLYSSSQQVKLYRGDVVELAAPADENEDYYKIKPPAGAHLFISTDYLQFLGTPEAVKAQEQPKQQPQPQGPVTEPSQLPMDETQEPAPIQEFQPGAEVPEAPTEPTTPQAEEAPKSAESVAIERITQLTEMIDQELTKPLTSQDYGVIKEALNAIQTDPQAGKAQLYAQLLLDRVGRYELAAEVNKQLAGQEESLETTLERIERAHQAQREQAAAKESPYLFVGTVKPSHVYTGKTGTKRYLVTDHSGRILCYAVPGNVQVQVRLDTLTGQKVGIQGTVVNDPSAIITTVMVSSVESLGGQAKPAQAPAENQPQ